MIVITGNTYPVRVQLRRLGCRWSPSQNAWVAPTPAVAAAAQKIVPAGTGRNNRGVGFAPRTCATCGCRINYGRFCGKCEYA